MSGIPIADDIRLAISILGPFDVRLDGEPATRFEVDAGRALLAYLLTNAETPQSRESLATAFWPGSSSKDASRSLRQTLNKLRTAIGDRDAVPPFLNISRQFLQFNRESAYWADVEVFNRILAEAHAHPHRRLDACPICMGKLAQAVGLYRGEFMAGFYLNSTTIEDWLMIERDKYKVEVADALQNLTRYHIKRRQYRDARRYAQQWMELQPWDEKAHRFLIETFALNGQRGAALAQYESSRAILMEQIAAEPSQEIINLYRQIRADTFRPPAQNEPNYPSQLTPFIGRGGEIAQIADYLNRENCRLISLVGPGGVGKTRLAVEVAKNALGTFEHGVFFISLEGVQSRRLMVTTIADSLNLPITEREDPRQQIIEYVRDREIFLILDNFEHILDIGISIVASLLREAPALSILITSRVRLNLHGEQVFEIHGLPQPPKGPMTDTSDALKLFLQSARNIAPAFTPLPEEMDCIADICRLVEGLPLAIELSAAWVNVFSVCEIAARLGGPENETLTMLDSPLRGLPQRHRSIRAVCDYSYRLLTDEEKRVFRALSVFRGGFDWNAAAEVAQTTFSILASLVNKSLIQHDPGQEMPRSNMHGLLRQYAAERLAQNPEEEYDIKRRHCEYMMAFLAGQYDALLSSDQNEALQHILIETENLRAAWEWASANKAAIEKLFDPIRKAMDTSCLFYQMRNWVQVAEQRLTGAISTCRQLNSSQGRLLVGKAITQLGYLWMLQRDKLRAEETIQQGIETLEGVADAIDARREMAYALLYLAQVKGGLGNYDLAKAKAQRALRLFREVSDRYGMGRVYNLFARAAHVAGEYDRAERFCQQSLVIHREMGNLWGVARNLNALGVITEARGSIEEAADYFRQALDIHHSIGDRAHAAGVLNNLSVIEIALGRYDRALELVEEGLQTAREVGERENEAICTGNIGKIAMLTGDYERAIHYLQSSAALSHASGQRVNEVDVLGGLVLLYHHLGQYERALRYGEEGLALSKEIGYLPGQAYMLNNLGHVLRAMKLPAESIVYYKQALAIREKNEKAALCMETRAGLARALVQMGRREEARAEIQPVLDYVEGGGSLTEADNPAEIYLTCYCALHNGDDPYAGRIVEMARAFLRAQADRIEDAEMRRGYLENVPIHREILQNDDPGFEICI